MQPWTANVLRLEDGNLKSQTEHEGMAATFEAITGPLGRTWTALGEGEMKTVVLIVKIVGGTALMAVTAAGDTQNQ